MNALLLPIAGGLALAVGLAMAVLGWAAIKEGQRRKDHAAITYQRARDERIQADTVRAHAQRTLDQAATHYPAAHPNGGAR